MLACSCTLFIGTLPDVVHATDPATVSAGSSRLINLSVRATAGTDHVALIVGFTIAGAASKKLLLRGVGPTLSDFGVPGVLADPVLTLFSGRRQIASNDDWGAADDFTQIKNTARSLAAFALPDRSPDAALLPELAGGTYTAQVTGKGSAPGIALMEIYDASTAATSKLVNLSVRSRVGTGSEVLLVGFAIAGSVPKQLLILAIGPSLADFGVDGVLLNPLLALFRQGSRSSLYQNDDWGGAPGLSAAFAATGAFSIPTASKDAALLVTLNPGVYTAQVSGADGATGVTLVEIYEMP